MFQLPTKVELDSERMAGMYFDMKADLPDLRERRDDWVRKMMRWHFDKDTGSRFWLQRRQTLNFDPIEDVRRYENIQQFGLFDKTLFNSVPLKDLIPRGFSRKPYRVFETGGTTGDPIRIVDVTTGKYNRIQYRAMLKARGLEGGDAVGMTPSGPHAYGNFVAELIASWHGSAFLIDFDPRWIKHLIRKGESTEPYVDHLVHQTLVLLETQHPRFLFTTAKLLLELVARLPKALRLYGVEAVCTGGTSCSMEEVRYLNENYLQGLQWIDTYGNTLMGHALQGDPWEGNPTRSYYLPPPLGYLEVVKPADWRQPVHVGERGRVLLVTLLEDLFIPNLLERDTAVKVGPHPWFPWDGVSAIRPYVETPSNFVAEGLY